MKVYLTRRYLFSASHRLHSAALSEETNREVYGKCNSPYGHGHNYFLEVTVSGRVAQQTGMICDLGELDATVEREVLGRFDHRNLNELQDFRGVVPTTESLAIRIRQILSQVPLPAHLEGIRIEETAKNSFEYQGDEPPRR